MPHDPLLIAETKAWFTKAANDLRAAAHEFSAVPPLLGDIVFHCQQAAEKAMKGFLTWHSRPFRKTHSLEEIGEQCLEMDQTLKPIVDRAVPLTEYAWKFRYPGVPDEPEDPSPARGGSAMTILAELRAEVADTLRRSPTQTLLWLDPQREWERLLDQLAGELELVKYDGSQLELRVKIEVEPTQRRRIVYVPLHRQALSSLKEYEFILPPMG